MRSLLMTFVAVLSLAPSLAAETSGMCASGRLQAPIAIENAERALMTPLAFLYKDLAVRDARAGSRLAFTVSGEHLLVAGTKRWRLSGIDLYAPALHGKATAELVFRHDGATLAVRVEEGPSNPELAKLLKGDMGASLYLRNLLPTRTGYTRYQGSDLEPPCGEPLAWYVLNEPITASAAEIALIKGSAKAPRPPQPRNGRLLLTGGGR